MRTLRGLRMKTIKSNTNITLGNNVYYIARAFVSIVESLVTIAALGCYLPDWSLDLAEWKMRRAMTKRKKERSRVTIEDVK